MKEEISNWRKDVGLDFIKRPYKDKLESAITCSSNELDKMEMSELDELMIVLSNYHLFISSEIGRLSASIRFLDDKLNMSVAKKTAKMDKGTATERYALVIATSEDLSKENEKLTMARCKREQLYPIHDAIKIKLDIMKRIFFRRTMREKE